MSPVKKGRRIPTVINRGLGLLEVIVPQSSPEPLESILPPGARDDSGFWIPEGHASASDLFSPARRKQQQNQRRIQRRRVDKASQKAKSAPRTSRATDGKPTGRSTGGDPNPGEDPDTPDGPDRHLPRDPVEVGGYDGPTEPPARQVDNPASRDVPSGYAAPPQPGNSCLERSAKTRG